MIDIRARLLEPVTLTLAFGLIANTAMAQEIEGKYWKATELAGKPTPAQDADREAHLTFQPGGVSPDRTAVTGSQAATN
jgi:hypothetical protein